MPNASTDCPTGHTVGQSHCSTCGLKWFGPGALSYDELVQACKNIGFDLSCGACAAQFFTGYTGPTARHDTIYEHDPNCKTEAEVKKHEPAKPKRPSSACQVCGADLHAPLCGICERKRLVKELETLRAFKTYILENDDEPKVRERFRQESGMELP